MYSCTFVYYDENQNTSQFCVYLQLACRIIKRVIKLKKHSKSYEQYCCILEKNIVMEETVYHNGTKSIVCTCLTQCNRDGGCRNVVLRKLWEADAAD